jgi:hypothetical protein
LLVAAYHQGVVEPGGPGDSRYAGESAPDAPEGHPVGIAWSETELGHPERQPEFVGFDAFNANTWNFKPAPPPWYDSPRAKLAIAAVSLAVVALVVSIVLLLFQGSSGDDQPSPATSTAPTTTSTTPRSSEVPPPPPPPPPTAETQEQAPVIRTRQPTRQRDRPEIGVTRTPVTRSPISVSPQPRSGSR